MPNEGQRVDRNAAAFEPGERVGNVVMPEAVDPDDDVLAYGLVVWAMATTPMGLVSALRETSVVLAAVIGTRLLGEPFGGRRVASANGRRLRTRLPCGA